MDTEEWPRCVAILHRILGDLERAEDAVQDALATALERWPTTGVPESPGGCSAARSRCAGRGPISCKRAIAAGHAQGSDAATIAAAYEALLHFDRSPVARLNHAVAVALAGSVEEGPLLLDDIPGLGDYRHFRAARADLLRRLGRTDDAHDAYVRALALTEDGPERRFLEGRLRGVVVEGAK